MGRREMGDGYEGIGREKGGYYEREELWNEGGRASERVCGCEVGVIGAEPGFYPIAMGPWSKTE